MMLQRGRSVVFAGMAVFLATPAYSAPPLGEDYAIGDVKASLAPSDTIGRRKAGLVCMPAGAYRWRDVRSGMMDAADVMTQALAAHAPRGLRIADRTFDGDTSDARYRINATITQVSLNACQKNWGIAAKLSKAKRLAGSASMTIEWVLADRVKRTRSGPITTTVEFDIADTKGEIEDVLNKGLRLNAADFAIRKWGSGAHE